MSDQREFYPIFFHDEGGREEPLRNCFIYFDILDEQGVFEPFLGFRTDDQGTTECEDPDAIETLVFGQTYNVYFDDKPVDPTNIRESECQLVKVMGRRIRLRRPLVCHVAFEYLDWLAGREPGLRVITDKACVAPGETLNVSVRSFGPLKAPPEVLVRIETGTGAGTPIAMTGNGDGTEFVGQYVYNGTLCGLRELRAHGEEKSGAMAEGNGRFLVSRKPRRDPWSQPSWPKAGLPRPVWKPLPAGVRVELYDFEEGSKEDRVLAWTRTREDGSATIICRNPNRLEEEPDLYFRVVRENVEHPVQRQLPPLFTTRWVYSADGQPGYYEDFTEHLLGSREKPLRFRIGLFFELKFRAQGAFLPEGLLVEVEAEGEEGDDVDIACFTFDDTEKELVRDDQFSLGPGGSMRLLMIDHRDTQKTTISFALRSELHDPANKTLSLEALDGGSWELSRDPSLTLGELIGGSPLRWVFDIERDPKRLLSAGGGLPSWVWTESREIDVPDQGFTEVVEALQLVRQFNRVLHHLSQGAFRGSEAYSMRLYEAPGPADTQPIRFDPTEGLPVPKSFLDDRRHLLIGYGATVAANLLEKVFAERFYTPTVPGLSATGVPQRIDPLAASGEEEGFFFGIGLFFALLACDGPAFAPFRSQDWAVGRRVSADRLSNLVPLVGGEQSPDQSSPGERCPAAVANALWALWTGPLGGPDTVPRSAVSGIGGPRADDPAELAAFQRQFEGFRKHLYDPIARCFGGSTRKLLADQVSIRGLMERVLESLPAAGRPKVKQVFQHHGIGQEGQVGAWLVLEEEEDGKFYPLPDGTRVYPIDIRGQKPVKLPGGGEISGGRGQVKVSLPAPDPDPDVQKPHLAFLAETPEGDSFTTAGQFTKDGLSGDIPDYAGARIGEPNDPFHFRFSLELELHLKLLHLEPRGENAKALGRGTRVELWAEDAEDAMVVYGRITDDEGNVKLRVARKKLPSDALFLRVPSLDWDSKGRTRFWTQGAGEKPVPTRIRFAEGVGSLLEPKELWVGPWLSFAVRFLWRDGTETEPIESGLDIEVFGDDDTEPLLVGLTGRRGVYRGSVDVDDREVMYFCLPDLPEEVGRERYLTLGTTAENGLSGTYSPEEHGPVYGTRTQPITFVIG